MQQKNYIKGFIDERHVSSFDVNQISPEGSIGIEIVRKLQETIFLKPFRGEEKIVVIEHAENLTIEAQNALLKLLEEPPLFVYIILCTPTEDAFLPTVLSRCKTIKLDQLQPSTPEIDETRIEAHLSVILRGTPGEKLALAEILAQDKENLSAWFEAITRSSRQRMLEEKNDTQQYVSLLHALQESYKTFTTTNVSPRTILEHTFLKLIHNN